MPRRTHTLAELVALAELLKQVRTIDVRRGDYVIVKTCNSVYTLRMIGDNECLASGGWFDRRGVSPVKTKITGCTWGGSALKLGVIAACGLCIEFANSITTSAIQLIIRLPYWSVN
jgi:hypothetical protein